MTTTRTKAEAKAELIYLVRADGFAPPEQCVAIADTLERALIGRRGPDWLEIVAETAEDAATLLEGAGDQGTLPWAAALLLQMKIGDCAEIRIVQAA